MSAIALPSSPSFWAQLKGLWAMSLAEAAPSDLPARAAKLEREVVV